MVDKVDESLENGFKPSSRMKELFKQAQENNKQPNPEMTGLENKEILSELTKLEEEVSQDLTNNPVRAGGLKEAFSNTRNRSNILPQASSPQPNEIPLSTVESAQAEIPPAIDQTLPSDNNKTRSPSLNNLANKEIVQQRIQELNAVPQKADIGAEQNDTLSSSPQPVVSAKTVQVDNQPIRSTAQTSQILPVSSSVKRKIPEQQQSYTGTSNNGQVIENASRFTPQQQSNRQNTTSLGNTRKKQKKQRKWPQLNVTRAIALTMAFAAVSALTGPAAPFVFATCMVGMAAYSITAAVKNRIAKKAAENIQQASNNNVRQQAQRQGQGVSQELQKVQQREKVSEKEKVEDKTLSKNSQSIKIDSFRIILTEMKAEYNRELKQLKDIDEAQAKKLNGSAQSKKDEVKLSKPREMLGSKYQKDINNGDIKKLQKMKEDLTINLQEVRDEIKSKGGVKPDISPPHTAKSEGKSSFKPVIVSQNTELSRGQIGHPDSTPVVPDNSPNKKGPTK